MPVLETTSRIAAFLQKLGEDRAGMLEIARVLERQFPFLKAIENFSRGDMLQVLESDAVDGQRIPGVQPCGSPERLRGV